MTRRVGLDVGSTGVRAVEIVTRRGRRTVARAARIELPSGAVRGGLVEDEAAVAEAIDALWSGGGFRPRTATVGLEGGRVLLRQGRDRGAPQGGAVKRLLPVPLDRSVVDTVSIGKGEEVRTLVVAAEREAVERLVAAVLRGGVEPLGVDAVPLALARAAAPARGAVALVDVGAQLTTMCVAVDGVVRVSRSIPVGGDDVTRGLAGRLGIERDAAEELKRAEQPDDDVRAAVRAEADWLAQEVASALGFESLGRPELAPERAVVSGGGARLTAFRDSLEVRLGAPVVTATPFASAEGSTGGAEDDDPAIAVAMGLALVPGP